MLRQPISYPITVIAASQNISTFFFFFSPPFSRRLLFLCSDIIRALIHSLAPDVLCTNGACLRWEWFCAWPWCPFLPLKVPWLTGTEGQRHDSASSQVFSRCLERAREMNKSNWFILRQENQGEDSKYWTNETLVLSERIKKEREMSKTGHGTHPGWRRTWNLNQWGKHKTRPELVLSKHSCELSSRMGINQLL